MNVTDLNTIEGQKYALVATPHTSPAAGSSGPGGPYAADRARADHNAAKPERGRLLRAQ